MTNLLTLTHINLAYGLAPLLSDANFSMLKGERICLIGRNGEGKSSLLKIIAQEIKPDSGTVWLQPGIKLARLEQELPERQDITIFSYVAQGLAELGTNLSQYYELTHAMQGQATKEQLQRLEQLQHAIEAADGWQFEQRINLVLTRLQLTGDKKLASLSGGWLRRAALAKALVKQPDILLLDEPTNHLDIKAIAWLEEYLVTSGITLLFITHDRALLQRLATRILELDRGRLTSWPGNYQAYLTNKEALLAAEEKQYADFDKKLAQEEAWIRQGIKARRTRNEGRVRALKAMRVERLKRRTQEKAASFQINSAVGSSQIVIEAKDISYSYREKLLIKHFSFILQRGDRVGLVGVNGAGKTTLLNLLLGKLAPLTGSVKIADQLAIAYFDQLRQQLDPEQTVAEAVSPGSDMILINGKQKHIISYLQDFLFTPERAKTPIKALSGGECNRLLLARLFSQPANLLVLDEPTNDLDIETLELLEELLMQYQGTVLIVSHDRQFLENVATSFLLFKGHGEVEDYIGDLSAIYQRILGNERADTKQNAVSESNKSAASNDNAKVKRKLSYQAQRELDMLPSKIEKLEESITHLQGEIATNSFYQQDAETIAVTLAKLKGLEDELTNAYARWEELEQASSN